MGSALVAVLVIAIFFRFWQLWSLPPGLHPDEAANGLDVFRIQDGDLRPLYNTNGPRESLFFFIQAIFVTIFGNTALALRLAPAIIGVLTVWVTYLWAKEWFSKRAALISALLVATAPWAVTLNRDGFRANMVPLMIGLSAWLFTKSVKQRKWYWYVLTGISLGAGFYTYISFRMVPFIILAAIIFSFWRYGKKIKVFVWPVILIGLVTALTLVPMGLYAYHHPDDVLGGRSSVSFTNQELNQGQPLKTLATTIGKTALMFNWQGDENYRHNLGGAPMLDAFTGIMLIFGILLALTRLRDIRYFLLLAIFGAMLVPEILTAEGIPHALRAIGVIPAIYILASIGIVELLARYKGVFPRNPAPYMVFVAIIVVVLGVCSIYNYRRVFVAWANAPAIFEAYSEDASAIGDYMVKNQFSGQRLVVIDGYSDKTVEYLTHNHASYQRLDAAQLDRANLDERTQIIVVEQQNSDAKRVLDGLGKEVKADVHYSPKRPQTTLFTVYEVAGGH